VRLPESQVRKGVPLEGAGFSVPPKKKGAPEARRMGFARLQPRIEPPPSLPSAGKAMPRQEGGHEQLSYNRAEEQADYAVDGGSKGRIELRRKAVEHRLGYLTTTSLILGTSLAAIIGRNRSGLRSICL